MRELPKGWPRLSTTLFYVDAPKMVEFLCRAFGFEVRLIVEGEPGQIKHSELTYGEALVGVNSERKGDDAMFGVAGLSPKSVGGANTQTIMLFVDDVDAHCATARAAGANIIDPPRVHDYGEEYWADRSYGAVDPEGHMWWFTQRVRDPKS